MGIIQEELGLIETQSGFDKSYVGGVLGGQSLC
jgi:hypothetical protein